MVRTTGNFFKELTSAAWQAAPFEYSISQFSYFSGINPALAENPIFHILMFQGPKRRPNDLEIYEPPFLEGTKRSSEGSKQAETQGPTILGLEPSMPSIFFPEPRLDLKTTIKIVSRHLSEGNAAETQKPRNRDLELQIGGGKLRRGAAGVVSIFFNNFSTVSMMKKD